MHLTYSENGKAEGRFEPGYGHGEVRAWGGAGTGMGTGSYGYGLGRLGTTLDYVTATLGQNENRSATLVTDLLGVVGTGVDPVTYRFSGGRSTN